MPTHEVHLADIQQFFETIYSTLLASDPPRRIELRAFAGGPPVVDTFTQIPDAVRACAHLSGRYDVYAGVALRHRAGGKEQVAALPAIWGDFDSEKLGLSLDDALAIVRGIEPAPAVIITSGHGVHAYWLLEPALTEDWQTIQKRAEPVMRAAVHLFGFDSSCVDVSRIMRVPGTVNLKEADKPVMCRIVEVHPDRRYTIEQIEDAWRTPVQEPDAPRQSGDLRPGDDFNDRAGWAEILEPHGWHRLFVRGETEFWQRPGKDGRGLSATVGFAKDRRGNPALYCFTDAAPPLETRYTYSKFAALAALQFNSNFADCAKWLSEQGYGTKSTSQRGAEDAHKHDTEPGDFALTDLGNAERLVAQHGDVIRWVAAWKSWLFYTGKVWKRDDTGHVRRKAHKTVRGIYGEAKEEPQTAHRKALAKWALQSESRVRIDAMIEIAKSLSGIAAAPEDFDTDPMLLNVGNGTINLRTGNLQEHRKSDMLTKMAGTVYDPAGECPIFDRFLARIMDNRTDLTSFIQRAAGYSLTGDVSERVFFLLWGTGANGKSTLLEIFSDALGDYAKTTPPETLMSKPSGAIPHDVARLAGARFVASSEGEEDRRLGEAFIKRITGNERVTARELFCPLFEFTPNLKLWFATNHRPKIKDQTDSTWDRVKLIPFTVRIPEQERDRRLRDKLRCELPGILAWMVRGCLDWQASGLCEPAGVRQATTDYRTEQDTAARFVAEHCVLSVELRITARELQDAYRQFCDAEGVEYQQKHLADHLKQAGCGNKRTKQCWYWLGVALRKEHEEPATEGKKGDPGDPDDPEGDINTPDMHTAYEDMQKSDHPDHRITPDEHTVPHSVPCRNPRCTGVATWSRTQYVCPKCYTTIPNMDGAA